MKKLNFGCRFGVKEGFDNVDEQIQSDNIRNFDFNKFPYPIEDNKYDYIYSNEILEHLFEPDRVLEELGRICRHNGIIEVIVPYYNNKGAFSNMDHKHFFSDVSFMMFVKERMDNEVGFEIESMELLSTNVGRFFPGFIRRKLSLFIGGLISLIVVRLRVRNG